MSKNFELMQEARIRGGALTMDERHLRPAAPNRKAKARVAEVHSEQQETTARREEYLGLVQNLFLARGEGSTRAVVFAGIDSGNACSSICARVAETLAEQRVGSVCVVDANLNSPALPQLFGVSPHRGFTSFLSRSGSIKDFTKPVRVENLWLFLYGSPEDLNCGTMEMSVPELRKEFDYVLIDSAPLNTHGDGITLAKLTDGLVLVLETNSTRREAVARVTASLHAAQIKILGAVLNKPIPEALYIV